MTQQIQDVHYGLEKINLKKIDHHTNLAKEMGFVMDLVIWLMGCDRR